uniref:Cytochrome b6-f complex subunit 7 n=1 Tax=Davidia involucrata TaxID=16924 RepID=A0A5B6YQL7_DAVIN
MATASAALSPARVSAAGVNSCESKAKKRMNKVVYIGGLNSYGGLKAHNRVASLGLPVCTEQCFAKVVNSLKTTSRTKERGGALSSTCDASAEIFKIAAIMNGLVLIGVAVGFVLLRIEAFYEDSE